jgi:hypothetical protein
MPQLYNQPEESKPTNQGAKQPQSDKVMVERLDKNGRLTGEIGSIPRANLQKAIESKKFKVAQ